MTLHLAGQPVALLTLGLCAVCASGGCKDKPSRQVVERETAPGPDELATAVGDAGASRDEPSYTAEEYARYKRHLHLGRAHAEQRRYGEAVREFDEALDVVPMDGRALSELGWAAFQAGDWQRARTANQDAVRVARQPEVKAASLYNLGRLAEVLGERADAEARYRESLALRASDAVEKRLAGLSELHPRERPSTASRCPATADLPALCACLVAESGARAASSGQTRPGPLATGPDDALAPSSCQSEPRDVPGVELLFAGDDSEEWVHLIRRGPDGWSSIAQLGRVYSSDADGVHEEFEVARFENRQIGERRVLWIEIAQTRTDDEARKRGRLAEREQRLVVCPWADEPATISCVLEVPRFERREFAPRVRTGAADKAPRVTTVFALDVQIGDDGRASVTLTRGKKTAELADVLGEHQLW